MTTVFPDNSILNYIAQSRPATANMLGLTPQASINQGFGTSPYTQVAGTAPGSQMNMPTFNMPQNAAPQNANNPMTNFNQSFGAMGGQGGQGGLTPAQLLAYFQAQRQQAQQPQAPQAPGAPQAPMSLAPPNPGPSASSITPSASSITPSPFSNDFMGRLAQMGAQRGGLVPTFAYLLGAGRRTGPDSAAGYGGPNSSTSGSGLGDIY
jgi:hypothetical protein